MRPCGTVIADAELGGRTFRRGVYCFTASDVRLNGMVTLDAEGDRDTVWIFRFDNGALTTGRVAQVLVIGNGYDGNAFWRTKDATTFGAQTPFIGNVFAARIAFGQGARISGRALARGGAVTANANRLLLCCAPITVTPATLPDGTLGTPYPETSFSATGGVGPYTFRVSSGSLPAGLTLAPNGSLRGMAVTVGSFAFTVTATDEVGCTGTTAYVVEIACGASTELVATVGNAFTKVLLKSASCTLSAGGIPSQFKLELEDCTLTGKAEAPGTFAFVVRSAGVDHCFTLEVEECPIVFTGPDPPHGTACAPYSHTFTAPGAMKFEMTGHPSELMPSSDGKLSGTTPLARSYDISVTATDALSRSCTRSFRLTFDCPAGRGAPLTIPRGTVGIPYDEHQLPNFSCAAGRFSEDSAPPPDFTVSESGVISGTPTQSGTHHFDVAYTSSDGCIVRRKVTIDVDCPVITLSDLPPMVQGVAYDETIAVSGIAGPFTVTDSGLPAGIVRDGLRIHGTPTSPGPYTFTVTVLHEPSGCRAIRSYPPTCAVILTTEWIPDGAVGVLYAGVAFSAVGGTEPYEFSVASGTLPPDLVLSTEGVLSGETTSAGTYTFVISTTDANTCTAARAYSIDVCAVCPAGVPALSTWALLLLIAALTWVGVTVVRRL